MQKHYWLFALFILSLFLPFVTRTSTKAAHVPLVVISIDGLKPDYVLEADRYGLKIPNLRRLQKEGTFATGVRGVLPTVTYPSHTTLVTGVSPAKHGIIANQPFDPFRRNHEGWYWYAEDIKVPTLWDIATKAGMVTSSVNWPVTVGANIQYNIVQYWRAGTSEDQKLIRALSTPGLLSEAERHLGLYPDGEDDTVRGDQRRAAFNIYLLEKKRPDLHFCYFTGLDSTQHRNGPNTSPTYAALETIDGLIGQVWAAAEHTYTGQVILCVVSDHGFFPTSKEVSLNEAFRQAGMLQSDAKEEITSWQVISWSSGGSAAIMISDKQSNETKVKAGEILKRLAENPDNGITRILDENGIRDSGGFPGAAFVVGMKKGYRVIDSLGSPLVKTGSAGGSHGFLPESPEMASAFLISGPGLPHGKNLGTIDMRDIAPTLAARLAMKLPVTDGKNLIP